MRTSVAVVLIGGLSVATWAVRAGAAAETVTGQVVDLVCYARNNANTGVDHDDGRVCAIACVKWEGNPVGILTADGKVYQFAGGLVANNNAKASPHLGHTVRVTGEVYEKDGMMMLAADALTMVSSRPTR